MHICKYLVRISLGDDRENDFEGGGVNPLKELDLPLKQVRMCCYCLNWVFEYGCAVCLDPITASSIYLHPPVKSLLQVRLSVCQFSHVQQLEHCRLWELGQDTAVTWWLTQSDSKWVFDCSFCFLRKAQVQKCQYSDILGSMPDLKGIYE